MPIEIQIQKAVDIARHGAMNRGVFRGVFVWRCFQSMCTTLRRVKETIPMTYSCANIKSPIPHHHYPVPLMSLCPNSSSIAPETNDSKCPSKAPDQSFARNSISPILHALPDYLSIQLSTLRSSIFPFLITCFRRSVIGQLLLCSRTSRK